MRKILLLSASLCLCALATLGCQQAETGQLNGHPLDGSWIGIGNAVGYDEDYSIENITLEISEDGVLTMNDNEQDTHDLSGAITVEDDHLIQIHSYEDPASLSLPSGWSGLQKEDSIQYDQPAENILTLSYKDITYFFKKGSLLHTSQPSPLYNLGENNVWYSNDGSKENETTYEFDLFNDYAELYSVSPNNSKALVTNFYYLKNDKNLFTFYTNIRPVKELPAIFSSTEQGLGTIDLKLVCKDESLIMTSKDQDLTFYNNVIYGLKTGGDSYSLCDKAFTVEEDGNTYQCHFSMNKDEHLYLYISQKTGEKEKDVSMVCGEIAMDEKSKTWIWYIDKKASAKTSDKNSDFYLKYSGLSGLKVDYDLEESNLHLKTAEATYDLKLTDYIETEKE